MPVYVTSKRYYDEFNGLLGGGVTYLNGVISDRIYCVIDFYIKWSSENIQLTLDASTRKISRSDLSDFGSFITDGFQAGDTFDLVASGSTSEGSYTIEDVTDRYIIVEESIPSEAIVSASIFGTTSITALDYYTNLCENEDSSFFNLSDRNSKPRYSIDDVMASGATSSMPMDVSTNSKAWVNGQTSLSEIGISNYKQQFRILQFFDINPVWLASHQINFEEGLPPAAQYYSDRLALKHVFKIDAKYLSDDPNIPHTIEVTGNKGSTSWFDEMNNGSASPYSVESIEYTDVATSGEVSGIQFCDDTNVTIIINDSSASFTDKINVDFPGSQFVLGHVLCTRQELDYMNQRVNEYKDCFRYDRKFFGISSSPVNGDEFGLDNQILTNITASYISASQVSISFTCSPSTTIQDQIADRDETDRQYALFVTTQPEASQTTSRTKRVCILCDFNSYYCNEDEPTLMGLLDYTRVYELPNELANPVNEISGYAGDPIYTRTAFWIDSTPAAGGTLQDVTVSIVATKAGEEDFPLEEKVFEASTVRKLDNIQTIDIQDKKGYVHDNFYNRANLIRNGGLDTANKAYFEIQYGLILRYEYWLEVIQLAEALGVAVFEDIENVTEDWSTYSPEGWSLEMKIIWNVKGVVSENITQFTTSIPMTVKEPGAASDVGTTFAADIKFYNSGAVEVKSILKDEDTYIEVTFTGDTSAFPAAFPSGDSDFCGYVFQDTEDGGSIFSRRFANTEFSSEDTTPFRAGDDPGDALDTRADGDVRISVYADRVVLSAIFSNDQQVENNNMQMKEEYVFGAKLGYKINTCLLLDAEEDPILNAQLGGIIINCS